MTDRRLRRILYGPHPCPECGTLSYLGETHCPECGVRMVNRNPVLRFLVTVAALAVVLGVVWYRLR